MAAPPSKREAMNALASRLLRPITQADPPTGPRSTMPQTVPATQTARPQQTPSTASQSDFTPAVEEEPAARSPSPPPSAVGNENIANASVPPSVSVSSANDGPQLRGSTAQIEAARAFAKSATQGGNKGQPSRARVLSKAPTGSASSARTHLPASTPSRTSTASSTSSYAPAMVSPRPRPSIANNSSIQARPAQASGGISQWHALRGSAPPSESAPAKPEAAQGSAAMRTDSANKPEMPDYTNESSSAGGKSAEVPRDATLPSTPGSTKSTPVSTLLPHQRAQAAAKAKALAERQDQTQNVSPSAASASSSSSIESEATVKDEVAVKPEVRAKDKTAVKPEGAAKSEVSGAGQGRERRIETPTIAVTPPSSSHNAVHTPTPSNDHNDDGTAACAEFVSEQLAVMKKRIESLEIENLIMKKQLEPLVQADERRQFLGTDNAKAPYGVVVEDNQGCTEKVQVHRELTIEELIRRVRTQAGLSPAQTMNARISVDGEQRGHMMTLGEAGVGIGKRVLFTYDGAR